MGVGVTNSTVQGDYTNGVTNASATNAGTQAAQNGQPLAPQQPNESEQAFQERQGAYNQGGPQ